MAIYGAFSSAMLGMMSQSRSLHNISVNISNVGTGGYKGTSTQFSTVLSRNINNVSDNGGVRPQDVSSVTKQGNIIASQIETDVAISGRGFFVMNTKQDGTGQSVYGRDGSLEIKTANDVTVTGIGGQSVTTKDGYLADKNGNFIQGWAYTNGTVTSTGTTSSLRVDQYAFIKTFEPTTTADLGLNLPAGNAIGDINQYDINVIDSLGTSQSVKLNFTKTKTLGWNVSTTSTQTPVAQVDTITLAGTPGEVGDKYTVSVNGTNVTYTTDGTEASLNVIRDNLIAAIVANPAASASATAAAGGAGIITLTAVTAGGALTNTSGATQGPVSVAQADTVTLAGGVALGDAYQVTINGITLSATAGGADTLTTLRDNILGQINANVTLGPLVTASTNGAAGINLVSDTAGTAYTLATTVTNNGGTPTNVSASVTANYTALNDNAATLVNTTANVLNSVTGANTAITFNSDGTIASPKTLTLALTFNGGGTSAAVVDISQLKQFYGGFLPQGYTKNGFASSNLKSFNFDSLGNVVGNFEDNTHRPIYKLALGVFANPNALESINGNVYRPTDASGKATITTAGSEGYATFIPNSRELSNVDLASEITKMLITQRAYNAASTVFRTADEMTTVARDLKR